ncbi:MAG: FG-GAP repeat domain-containing protein, partial [Pyrinomonadaceae bacterium]
MINLSRRPAGPRVCPLVLLTAATLLWPWTARPCSAQTPAPQAQPTPGAAPTPSPAPQQAPTRTGRSYSGGDPVKRPPPASPQSPSPVTFTDITASSGVTFRHAASPTSQKYLLETMSGGVAMFDYDSDGRLDLYFTNGAVIGDPMPKNAAPEKLDARFWNRLYRQKADGTFDDVTEKAGVRGEGYSMGAAAGDYDADGFVDLYVTSYGANILYRNRGDGTFEDVTARAGVGDPRWSAGASFFDYDADGHLDLFVANYVDFDFQNLPEFGKGKLCQYKG